MKYLSICFNFLFFMREMRNEGDHQNVNIICTYGFESICTSKTSPPFSDSDFQVYYPINKYLSLNPIGTKFSTLYCKITVTRTQPSIFLKTDFSNFAFYTPEKDFENSFKKVIKEKSSRYPQFYSHGKTHRIYFLNLSYNISNLKILNQQQNFISLIIY